jgi:hypothetical protein
LETAGTPTVAIGWIGTMKRLYAADDFEAVIRIFRPDEGGRSSSTFNGIRWDFVYADEEPADGLYMIWPDFVDDNGDSLPADAILPVDASLPARMVVVNDEMREKHRSKIRVGGRFYCCEGPKRVAEGRVTKVTELLDPRPQP